MVVGGTRKANRMASQNGQRKTRGSAGGAAAALPHNDDNNSREARYEDIMGLGSGSTGEPSSADKEERMSKATQALSGRLVLFRKWLTEEAKVTIHPAICVVNGEATDGTRNAPLLALPPSEDDISPADDEARLGRVDGGGDQALYDKTMGCQIRTTREIKKDDVMMEIPRPSMVTPDLIACSDAGRAILACCKATDANGGMGFWDAFANTTECEAQYNAKVVRNNGLQSLMKILQERKKMEAAVVKRLEKDDLAYALAEVGAISTRAPVLAFLIHQRFSNHHRPAVTSAYSESLDMASSHDDGNALIVSKTLKALADRPETFAPYARTLPAVVPMPLCWKRNELALLTGCIPGIGILQEVAAQTMQLAAEFSALVDAGVLERFPDVFPPGVLSWDRWVWAASVCTSRILPAACYLNDGDRGASDFKPLVTNEFQSPPQIWDELGVMIPLLDMLNHEIDAHQVTFNPCKPESSGADIEVVTEDAHPPRAIFHKKVRKGSEVFTAYGKLNNHNMIIRYGMAQMNNFYEEVKIGWGLGEAVGGVSAPADYSPVVEGAMCVFDSADKAAIDLWWSEERLALLQREAGLNDTLIKSLKQGRKLQTLAYNGGAYDPTLISAALVACVPSSELSKHSNAEHMEISREHLNAVRNFLASAFRRKLKKLLQNLESGLKAKYNDLNLWTNASEGGLRYTPGDENDGTRPTGWQTFFDKYAYQTSMEVEKNFYAMGPGSCTLTLYDGQLRTLQTSLEGLVDVEKFHSGLLQQLEELGHTVVEGKPTDDSVDKGSEASKTGSPEGKNSPGRKKRNKKKSTSTSGGERPPALKLHVGNLSYGTTPSDLYDYFSTLYGKEHVLECHIPIERATGRSRGFGFVTMPESIAESVMVSTEKHEIDGRLLKVAKSNSAGTSDAGRAQPGPTTTTGDRCAVCGYRPRYCECSNSNAPPGAVPPAPSEPRARDSSRAYGEPNHRGSPDRTREEYRRADRYRDDSHRRREPDRESSRDFGREHDRAYNRNERDYDRGYDRDNYDRDYEMDRDRHRYRDYDKEERRSRSERSRERRRDRSREHSRGSRSPSRRREEERRRERHPVEENEWDRDRKRSRSRSRERSRKKKSKKREG